MSWGFWLLMVLFCGFLLCFYLIDRLWIVIFEVEFVDEFVFEVVLWEWGVFFGFLLFLVLWLFVLFNSLFSGCKEVFLDNVEVLEVELLVDLVLDIVLFVSDVNECWMWEVMVVFRSWMWFSKDVIVYGFYSLFCIEGVFCLRERML